MVCCGYTVETCDTHFSDRHRSAKTRGQSAGNPVRQHATFCTRKAANNALLWDARGTGKSSLVKAVHATVNQEVLMSQIYSTA